MKDYNSLCKKCRIRQGLLNRENLEEPHECLICNNLMSRLDSINKALVSELRKGYEFSTFQIGVSLPPSYVEREDNIRSRLRVKGRANIKNEFLSNLRELISQTLNKEMDYLSPDIRIDLLIKEDNKFFFNIIPAPVILACKYLKKKRGIPQKRPKPAISNDLVLNYSSLGDKSSSLEEGISKYLKQITLGEKVKFSWIGGEDKESLVLGSGRPFFAEIIKPKRRFITKHNISLNEDGIELFVLSALRSLPQYPMKFVSTIRISIIAEKQLKSRELERLSSLSRCTVWFRNKKKVISREVHCVKTSRVHGNKFGLEIIAEGGLHIKQFVGGKEYCEPNISAILGLRCECLNFDIIDVWLQDQYALEGFQLPSSLK